MSGINSEMGLATGAAVAWPVFTRCSLTANSKMILQAQLFPLWPSIPVQIDFKKRVQGWIHFGFTFMNIKLKES